MRVHDPNPARGGTTPDHEQGDRAVAIRGVPPRSGFEVVTRDVGCPRLESMRFGKLSRFAHEEQFALGPAHEILELFSELHDLVALGAGQLWPNRAHVAKRHGLRQRGRRTDRAPEQHHPHEPHSSPHRGLLINVSSHHPP